MNPEQVTESTEEVEELSVVTEQGMFGELGIADTTQKPVE